MYVSCHPWNWFYKLRQWKNFDSSITPVKLVHNGSNFKQPCMPPLVKVKLYEEPNRKFAVDIYMYLESCLSYWSCIIMKSRFQWVALVVRPAPALYNKYCPLWLLKFHGLPSRSPIQDYFKVSMLRVESLSITCNSQLTLHQTTWDSWLGSP